MFSIGTGAAAAAAVRLAKNSCLVNVADAFQICQRSLRMLHSIQLRGACYPWPTTAAYTWFRLQVLSSCLLSADVQQSV